MLNLLTHKHRVVIKEFFFINLIIIKKNESTPERFELSLQDGNSLAGCRLNRSAKVSYFSREKKFKKNENIKIYIFLNFYLNLL